uniref:RING finger protein 37 N-terminal domain-containing protein n=1 Tax=Bracon brevicornis TaxID=1563983 RepID=A0A6V7IP60_9HYME
MLLNFCQESLKTIVKCDTISTEGYEVENLLKTSNRGFLAYSCMKPPVNIDFTFHCNIKINHIIIWPSIGAQKSTGFRFLVKSNSIDEFRTVGSGFLKPEDAGMVVQRADGDVRSITKPVRFSTISLKIGNKLMVDRIRNLRISIIKTDKTVPSISRIEIWGYISSWNSSRLVREINELFLNPIREQLAILDQQNRVEVII